MPESAAGHGRIQDFLFWEPNLGAMLSEANKLKLYLPRNRETYPPLLDLMASPAITASLLFCKNMISDKIPEHQEPIIDY